MQQTTSDMQARNLWKDVQRTFDVEWAQPPVVRSAAELQDVFDAYSFTAFEHGLSSIPEFQNPERYVEGLRSRGGTMVHAYGVDDGRILTFIGPIILGNVPSSLKESVLAHEFSHYLSYMEDPAYACATVHLLQQVRTGGRPTPLFFATENQERLLYDLYNESIGWAGVAELYGKDAIQEHWTYVLDELTDPPIHLGRLMRVPYEWAAHDSGLCLSQLGRAKEAILQPASQLTDEHPLIQFSKPRQQKKLARWMERFSHLYDRYKEKEFIVAPSTTS